MKYFLLHLWRKQLLRTTLGSYAFVIISNKEKSQNDQKFAGKEAIQNIYSHIDQYIVDNLKEIDTKLLNNSHFFVLFFFKLMDKHNIIIIIGVSAWRDVCSEAECFGVTSVQRRGERVSQARSHNPHPLPGLHFTLYLLCKHINYSFLPNGLMVLLFPLHNITILVWWLKTRNLSESGLKNLISLNITK